jgi:hydroxymethylbilane synthase
VPLRGNVDTRLRKLDAGEADAIVLAAAGLRRLGLAGRIGFLLDPEVFVPEAGQGAIAVQVRAGEEGLVSALDHAPTRRAVQAERDFARSVGGGCSVPVAAYAWDGPDGLELRTWVAP